MINYNQYEILRNVDLFQVDNSCTENKLRVLMSYQGDKYTDELTNLISARLITLENNSYKLTHKGNFELGEMNDKIYFERLNLNGKTK